MNEYTEKRIVAFTSQSLRQYGIRAVRMNDIAKNMNISKRTIYQVYNTKNNLINTCLDAYLSRIENLFYIIRYSSSDVLSCLWKISLAYMDNLYKGECAFWLDINRYLEYKYIYTAHNRMWRDGLGKVISACQQEDYVVPDLDIQMFLESFTTLLYNARIAECPPIVLHKSAYFMLRGIMTSQGAERLEKIENQFAESMKK